MLTQAATEGVGMQAMWGRRWTPQANSWGGNKNKTHMFFWFCLTSCSKIEGQNKPDLKHTDISVLSWIGYIYSIYLQDGIQSDEQDEKPNSLCLICNVSIVSAQNLWNWKCTVGAGGPNGYWCYLELGLCEWMHMIQQNWKYLGISTIWNKIVCVMVMTMRMKPCICVYIYMDIFGYLDLHFI